VSYLIELGHDLEICIRLLCCCYTRWLSQGRAFLGIKCFWLASAGQNPEPSSRKLGQTFCTSF